ncbi:hypothetical protein [Faecalibacter bovis]|uniref:C1q domain-containing protein n=1 Tax=Faecalibacter bovis TaxID=2898187 RepID=A0ABX7XDE4_9FLAO|nr:hypothetical protein [Faecalibacter bovis]QTV05939.1 hypothetical protein J9309_00895 [Faecalibacter bovis]
MTKYIYAILVIMPFLGYSQVGIMELNPKATLHINASKNINYADGVIFPQLSLAELTSKGNNLYNTNHTGAIIYIHDISGGNRLSQRENIASIGYYFFDGTLWQKINIEDKNLYEDDYHLTSNRTLNLDGKKLAFENVTGNPIANQFSIGGNLFSVDTNANKVGIGTLTPNARLDIRTLPTSTTDPGEGEIGIGTAYDTSASAAGAGAIRYNTIAGGILQYSNGIDWYTLKGDISKATVVATKTTSMSIPEAIDLKILDWSETVDNQNLFNPAKGTFTAPRTGNYLISFSYGFDSGNYNDDRIEAQLQSSRGNINYKKSVIGFPGVTNDVIGTANITFVMRLNAGETINPAVYHNSSTKTITTAAGYNNFSVVEL